jgi:hypothetical protein
VWFLFCLLGFHKKGVQIYDGHRYEEVYIRCEECGKTLEIRKINEVDWYSYFEPYVREYGKEWFLGKTKVDYEKEARIKLRMWADK